MPSRVWHVAGFAGGFHLQCGLNAIAGEGLQSSTVLASAFSGVFTTECSPRKKLTEELGVRLRGAVRRNRLEAVLENECFQFQKDQTQMSTNSM
ncbi:hypothetical protein HAX54_008640 [Datura stramonium]|uniref:Uncharacterized protein n=1 Tax=Datura stramonium TaxID=4076 RepID=A0ABS8TEZ5_DATST|nr:hypothetical protein [Datura stramonium]